ncbi:MAG TPA: D-2-hydroxyacid dehydrogenase, partial [Dehalococcoidales bacterium]
RPFKDFGFLAPKHVRMIEAVSPRIKLWDVSELIQAEQKGDPTAKQELDTIVGNAEIFFGFPPPRDLIARAPNLKWIQDILAGVEVFLSPAIVASPVVLTNARGIHPQVVESALMMALMLAKKMPLFTNNKNQKIWKKETPGLLSFRTAGILGLGHIGSDIAKTAKAFGMKVIGLEIRAIKKPAGVDVMLPPEKLNELLAQSDFIFIALPLTSQTRGLIGEREFKLMKPSAFLINISRGAIVDESALVQAVKSQRIAGAGLDVFTIEPLPVTSPLWNLENVILTPHVAGLADNYDEMVTRLFCSNLKRYLKGRELLKMVDKVKGY